jgi:membrane fusion protein, multidrug efflux system
VNRFLRLAFILAVLILGYSQLSVSVRERFAGLFSLDYEIPVEVFEARMESMAHTLTARAELEPVREIKINATVPGVIKEIRYAAGARVSAGAVVAVLESNDLSERLRAEESAVQEAEVNVNNSQNQLAAAETQVANLRDLFRRDLIARRDADRAEAAVETNRVQLEVARAQFAQRTAALAQTRHVLSLATITAPRAGIVTRQWVEPGAAVSEGAPVLSMARADTLRILVNLKIKDAQTLHPGISAQVKVNAFPQRVFRGKVTQVQEVANFAGDELSVEVEIPNRDGALKFGMPAKLMFSIGEQRYGIFVPQAAVIEAYGNNYLYVFIGGKARRRYVVVGEERKDRIEIASGLQPGEAVIIRGSDHLRDGARARVVQ